MTTPDSPPEVPTESKKRRIWRTVAVNVVVSVVLLCLIEGAAHFILLGRMVLEGRGGFARVGHTVGHTDYDSLLGWVNYRDVHVPDQYGPGIDITTNSRGFRGSVEFPDEVPDGWARLVCTGDSFTLGYGVGDEESWCHLLSELLPGVEAVNMGQGGYGVDQAYLWYGRDAVFDHDLVLFAFIGPDFDRMWDVEYVGYDKPMLAIEADSVVPTNVPVPTTSYDRSRGGSWRRTVPTAISSLKTIELLRRVGGKLGLGSGVAPTEGAGRRPRSAPTPEQAEITRAMFRTLTRTVEARGARLATIYLPEMDDYVSDQFDGWKSLVEEAAREGGWPFWDLTEEFREVPPVEAARLFIRVADGGSPGAEGHYNPTGNRFVADHLQRRLEEWGWSLNGPAGS